MYCFLSRKDRHHRQASKLLIAVAQSKDNRPADAGTAGVDDSVVFGRSLDQIPGVKGCPLPDTYASSCWGMPFNAVTFHANCVPDDFARSPAVSQKVKLMHEAMDEHSRHTTESQDSTKPVGGDDDGAGRGFLCWKNGVRCGGGISEHAQVERQSLALGSQRVVTTAAERGDGGGGGDASVTNLNPPTMAATDASSTGGGGAAWWGCTR